MTGFRRLATVVALGALTFLAGMPAARAGLSITAPANRNLGSAATGTATLSAQLGTVTATHTSLLPLLVSFTATVTCTDFTTGAGGPSQTIAKSSISYWSGPATATTGAGTFTPGQLTALNAQNLSVPRTAFSVSSLLSLTSISVSWNPTIVINIPAAAVVGTYTGTITHSVA